MLWSAVVTDLHQVDHLPLGGLTRYGSLGQAAYNIENSMRPFIIELENIIACIKECKYGISILDPSTQ